MHVCVRSFLKAGIAFALTALIAMPSGAQNQATYRFDLPQQPLAEALRAIARQTGENVLFESKDLKGITAPALRGELTTGQAIERMLAGTKLQAQRTTPTTVVVQPAAAEEAAARASVNRTGRADIKSALRLANTGSEGSGPQSPEPPEADTTDKEIATEEIRVTGSRIRRDPAETDISPVTVFTRQDIERTGAVVIAEFLGKITQAASVVALRETGNDPTSGRTTVNLRGLGNNTTLVLLNGRRLPKSAQGFGQDDYNLNGIPLASVERIEVLTNSASAIYGSDAIGGVVNIITREHYQGIDVAVQYGNTFDSDVSQKSTGLTFGHAGTLFGARKFALTLNLSANEQNKLAAKDRPYTALSDYSASGGRPPQPPGPFTHIGAAGSVSTVDDPYDDIPAPLLPGLDVSTAAIPANQDGRSLTQADFIGSGPLVNATGDRPDYRLLLAPSEEQAGSLSATLDLTPHMQLFVEGSHSRYRNDFEDVPPVAEIPVPADNPFNPFGVDVVVRKVFYELGPSRGIMTTENTRFASGLRGALGRDWRYEAYGDYTRYVGASTNPVTHGINFSPEIIVTPEGELEFIPTPAGIAIAETDPARALNVFGDGRTTQPNDLALLRSLLGVDDYRETSETWTGSLQADGPIAQLPGGAVKLALGGEFRKEQVGFYKLNTSDRYFVSLDEGASRDVTAAFAELSVPVIGERQNIRGAQMLMLSAAVRLDSESLFGEELTPKVGLMWRPARSLALRASYGHGYKVPNLQQLFGPDITYSTIFYDPPLDPVTHELLDGDITVREGGNPDLLAEKSTSWSAGLILEPTALPRLSLSVDYFHIDYTNKVQGFVGEQIILNLFPERVQRDADGHPVLIDMRAVNLATAKAEGIDVRLVHRLQTATHGSFDTQINYTYNISNTQQSTPTSAVIENVDTFIFPRVRANATVFWNYGGFELGPTVTYESSTRNDPYYGYVFPARVRRAVVLDVQGSFDFDRDSAANRTRWMEGLKLTAGIDNLLDRTPSPTDGDGGYARIDPRQRRFYLSLRKTF